MPASSMSESSANAVASTFMHACSAEEAYTARAQGLEPVGQADSCTAAAGGRAMRAAQHAWLPSLAATKACACEARKCASHASHLPPMPGSGCQGRVRRRLHSPQLSSFCRHLPAPFCTHFLHATFRHTLAWYMRCRMWEATSALVVASSTPSSARMSSAGK